MLSTEIQDIHDSKQSNLSSISLTQIEMKLSSQTLEVTLQQEEFIIYVYTEENCSIVEVVRDRHTHIKLKTHRSHFQSKLKEPTSSTVPWLIAHLFL